METNESGLQRAMRMAVESGMLPKYADEETYLRNWQTMRHIIELTPEPQVIINLPNIAPDAWLAMLPAVVAQLGEAQREALVTQTLDAFNRAGVELAGCLLNEFEAARWWR